MRGALAARIKGMHWGQHLHARPEQRVVTDTDTADIKDYAVKIEENPFTQLDVGAVVAIKWRLHPHRIAALTENLLAQLSAQILIPIRGGAELLAKLSSLNPSGDQLGGERVVQFTRQHLLLLCDHGSSAFIVRPLAIRDAWPMPAWVALPLAPLHSLDEKLT